jgi:hypothetical protein
MDPMKGHPGKADQTQEEQHSHGKRDVSINIYTFHHNSPFFICTFILDST